MTIDWLEEIKQIAEAPDDVTSPPHPRIFFSFQGAITVEVHSDIVRERDDLGLSFNVCKAWPVSSSPSLLQVDMSPVWKPTQTSLGGKMEDE